MYEPRYIRKSQDTSCKAQLKNYSSRNGDVFELTGSFEVFHWAMCIFINSISSINTRSWTVCVVKISPDFKQLICNFSGAT